MYDVGADLDMAQLGKRGGRKCCICFLCACTVGRSHVLIVLVSSVRSLVEEAHVQSSFTTAGAASAVAVLLLLQTLVSVTGRKGSA